MTAKNRALCVLLLKASSRSSSHVTRRSGGHQQGFSLIELMVGLAVGLLVISIAMVGLMASRGLSGTVTDASLLQQQASYAFHLIGQQVRPAGSRYLNLMLPAGATSTRSLAATPVAFETTAIADGGNSFDARTDTLTGTDQKLSLGYRRFTENLFSAGNDQVLARNCLGGPVNSNKDKRLESIFEWSGTDLRCSGNDSKGAPQPIIGNVADFQLRYLQTSALASGQPKLQYVDADTAKGDWSRITGVEVCLVLYGNEPIDLPEGSSYVGCDNTSIDVTALDAPRSKRLHMVFRSVFQLRSQGVS